MGLDKENRGRSVKGVCNFNWYTIRKDTCIERCGEYCRRGRAVKELTNPSKRIILVTSAYHMFRAKRLFEKQGFIVISCKVDYKVIGNNQVTFMDFLSSAINLELTEIEFREIIGRLYYLL